VLAATLRAERGPRRERTPRRIDRGVAMRCRARGKLADRVTIDRAMVDERLR
jgi:hypothetical protein